MSGKGPTTTAKTNQDSEGESSTKSSTSSDTTGSSTTSQSGTSSTAQSGQSSTSQSGQSATAQTGQSATSSQALAQQASQTNPWDATLPGLQQLIAQLSGTATTDTFRPTYSDATMRGVAQLQDAAAGGSVGQTAQQFGAGLFGNAQAGVDTLTGAARGDNLNGNPYLQKQLDSQYGNIQNRIAEQFSSAGRLGSGMQQKVTTEALAKAANDAALSNYNTERGYQMSGAGALSNLGQAFGSMGGTLDSNSLFGAKTNLAAGQVLDAQEEANRKADLNAYDYRLNALKSLAGLGQSSTGTSQQVGQSGTTSAGQSQTATSGQSDTQSSSQSKTDSSSTSKTDSTSSTDSTTDSLTKWIQSMTGEQVNSTKTDKTSQIVGGLLAAASLFA